MTYHLQKKKTDTHFSTATEVHSATTTWWNSPHKALTSHQASSTWCIIRQVCIAEVHWTTIWIESFMNKWAFSPKRYPKNSHVKFVSSPGHKLRASLQVGTPMIQCHANCFLTRKNSWDIKVTITRSETRKTLNTWE